MDKNIDRFNPKSIVKVSSQLYEMDKRRIDLSIYGYRLLYATLLKVLKLLKSILLFA